MSHQSHGLPQSVPLSRDEGLVLVSQATRSGYHELSNLVVQAVERLDRCKGSKGELRRWKHTENSSIRTSRSFLYCLVGFLLSVSLFSGILWFSLVWFPWSTAIVESIVLLFRIIPLWEKRGIIRLNPLPVHSLSTHNIIHFYGESPSNNVSSGCFLF